MMKITRRQLEKIIKEETEKIEEAGDHHQHSKPWLESVAKESGTTTANILANLWDQVQNLERMIKSSE
jgi:hypothetical protein